MPVYQVFHCEPEDQTVTVDLAGNRHGACDNGGGQWIEIDMSPWYLGAVDSESFGALLTAITFLLCMAYAIRLIVRTFKGR